jgi:regulator of protease activity HflC (stomatin/prohibitin superfamily)
MNYDFMNLMNTGVTVPQTTGVWRHVFTVSEFEAVLLYRHGVFERQLEAGRQLFWGRGYGVIRVDTRAAILNVAGQEVLSADNVGLKVSVAVTRQIVDARKAIESVQDWQTQLYTVVQLAVRTLIAAQPVEALLTQRMNLGRELLAAVLPEAEKLGVKVTAVEVKDVMFPGELKKIFAEVVRAKQEGLAALERARGESAALRNLANAARLLENSRGLQNLRLLQSMNAGHGNTFVMGVPGFVPLKGGKNGAKAESAGEAKDAETE